MKKIKILAATVLKTCEFRGNVRICFR